MPENLDSPRPTARRAAKPRRRRRGVWITLGALGLIIAILVGVAAVWLNGLKNSFESKSSVIENVFPDESSRPPKSADGSTNILLLGSDKRPTPVDPKVAVPGGGADQRSDSIMLVNISADRKHVSVISVMRDLWVPIPGHGENKVNAGYALGGYKLEVQTLEQLLQTRIDHVAEIDMASFEALGNAMGGLDVYVEKETTLSHLDGTVLKPGMTHMDGRLALAFSRERYAYADGDYQRVRNQHAVMSAILKKLMSKETLSSPSKIKDITDLTSPYVSHDPQFDFATISRLGFELRNVRAGDVKFATMPTAGTGWSKDGQSIVLVDEKGLASLRTALKDDKVAAWLTTSDNHEKP
ncbi:LCP family protein [Falsarthrobacter nasiphocae]|uniref:LCP family protein required for cell wall assembly n=1 Tax=Falsarthrobacter nasiphocae TaxID=189863 RepID=A0AAE3YIV2_9MICC|nr:LCP family protein [Falsarthrobacter nasiphocae]MDR6892841.1 LCP family protein required for cell wall assembly [Falsarthrobacter nasiphocae]